MENTDPRLRDDWPLDRAPHSRLSDDLDDDGDGRSSSGTPTLLRQTTIVGSVVIIIIVVTLLVLNTIIEPVQHESKEIKGMISALQDFRRSDIGILQARFDQQEEILRNLLQQMSERNALPSVLPADKAASTGPVNGKAGNTALGKNTDQYTLYVVKKNDTLGGIAYRHKVSVKKILEENELNDRHRLKIGQALYIPMP